LRRHRELEDRNRAPLRPRRELLESLVAYAVYLSARRRRRQRLKPAPINTVADRGQIWFKGHRGKVLERFREHAFYLEHGRARRPGERHGRAELHHMSPRTLTRHVAALRRDRLVAVGNFSRFDRRRGEWIQEPNVYTITRAGVLWITRHARALQIPRFL
jgi:DNA-binding transcriptional ArsR family regulator